MILIQSGAYEKKIAATRSMAEKSEEERLIKQEKASELRMEIMMDQAALGEALVSHFIHGEWYCTSKWDLEKIAEDAGFVMYPESTELFIEALDRARKSVELVLESFEKRNKNSRERKDQGITEMSKELLLFRALQKDVYGKATDYEPKGTLVLDETYPLALVLYVENEEDFQQIDTRKNVGGFYVRGVKFGDTDDTKGQQLDCPVIAIYAKDVLEHEKKHAEHAALLDAFSRERFFTRIPRKVGDEQPYFVKHDKRTVVWATDTIGNIKELTKELEVAVKEFGEVDELLKHSVHTMSLVERKLAEIKKRKAFDQILGFALGKAKDELLADYARVQKADLAFSVNDYFEHLNNLLHKEGVYDYFLHRVHLSKESELYKELWDEYETTLKEQVDSVKYIVQDYCVYRWNDRIAMFRWLLAQTPIQKWKSQFRGTRIHASPFIRELNKVKEIERMSFF